MSRLILQAPRSRLARLAQRQFAADTPFLERRSVNHAALSPLTFLQRTAAVFPERTAIVYADWKAPMAPTAAAAGAVIKQTWGDTAVRVSRLASSLARHGVGRGDIVAVLSPNTPSFVELHHGVNACGAIINPLNTRLDADTLAYILQHSAAKVLLADTALGPAAAAACAQLATKGLKPPLLIDLVDPIDSHHPEGVTAASAPRFGSLNYEELLGLGDEV
jgi:fatty-acyl-CoA synthase